MRGILFDLDGVIYQGQQAVPGAAEIMAWVKRHRIAHLLVSNTSSRPRSALVEKLARLGIKFDEESILTPALVARHWLKRHAPGKVALFVPEAARADFSGQELLDEKIVSGAAAVVVGHMGRRWDYALLNRAFRLLMDDRRPPLVALGMSRYLREEDGLSLDVAPFVKALEVAAATEAEILGKPSAHFFHAALELLGTTAEQTVMVGDDIDTDIRGAMAAGLGGILVRTGKFLPRDLAQGILPTAVLDSVADLPGWWLKSD